MNTNFTKIANYIAAETEFKVSLEEAKVLTSFAASQFIIKNMLLGVEPKRAKLLSDASVEPLLAYIKEENSDMRMRAFKSAMRFVKSDFEQHVLREASK